MELIIKNRKGQNFIVLYDEIDKEIVEKYTWHVTREKDPYVRTTIRDKIGNKIYLLLHREILNIKDSKQVCDHINRNTLDNRRSNIRICTSSENNKNKKAIGKSKYLGVCQSTGRDKWQATIKIDGKYKMLGRFDTEEEAARTYDKFAKIHHKEFANLNFK